MTHSIIDKNGEESIDFCAACHIDKLTGHCDGQILSFENNHQQDIDFGEMLEKTGVNLIIELSVKGA